MSNEVEILYDKETKFRLYVNANARKVVLNIVPGLHGYTIKNWSYEDTRNIFRFWAPHDIMSAVMKGMAEFERCRQREINRRNNIKSAVETAQEIAKDYQEIRELTKGL